MGPTHVIPVLVLTRCTPSIVHLPVNSLELDVGLSYWRTCVADRVLVTLAVAAGSPQRDSAFAVSHGHLYVCTMAGPIRVGAERSVVANV